MDGAVSLPTFGLRAENAGLFISWGQGIHPCRRLPSYELILVTAGSLEMREEARTFRLAAGDVLLLLPGREHAGAAPYMPDCAFYWVHFRLPEDPSGSAITIPQTATLQRPERMVALFRRFLDDQVAATLTPVEAAHLIALMLCEVARAAEETQQGELVTATAAALAGRVQRYILQHLGDSELATATIARALDVHPDYLGRCFRQAQGETVTQAIHRERLRQAKALLLDSGETVERIAHQCGFGTALFFRRLFRRSEGASPTEFRRLYARVHLNSS